MLKKMLGSFMSDKANPISNYLHCLVVVVYLFHTNTQNNQFVCKETKKTTKKCALKCLPRQDTCTY